MESLLVATPQAQEATKTFVDSWSTLGPGFQAAAALCVLVVMGLLYELNRQHSLKTDLQEDKDQLNQYIRETHQEALHGIRDSTKLMQAVADEQESMGDEVRSVLDQYSTRMDRILTRLEGRLEANNHS